MMLDDSGAFGEFSRVFQFNPMALPVGEPFADLEIIEL